MDKKSIKPLEELLDSVRDIDGFPIGEDEDILALSDPPFYTACPNPYIEEFIEEYGTPYNPENDDYKKLPFFGDIKENKNDVLSNVHYYVTKVPYKALIHFILHYTKPGDIIFDGFSGSGMAGLAAQMCENPSEDLKNRINERIENPEFGKRYAILNEISPFASFISQNYNSTVDEKKFEKIGSRILKTVKEECEWFYETNDNLNSSKNKLNGNPVKGKINNIIWSDVFICPYCDNEYNLWDLALDFEEKKVLDKFECNSCRSLISKKECERLEVSYFDKSIGKEVTQKKMVPVLINYSVGKKKYSKKPDEKDLELLNKIENLEIPYWYPTYSLPEGYNTKQPIKSHGFTHVHHFFTKRNLWVISKIVDEIKKIEDKQIQNKLLFVVTSLLFRSSKRAVFFVKNYFHGGGGYITTISGNLSISSLSAEVPVIEQFENRLKKIGKINDYKEISSENVIVSTGSSTNLKLIPENSIDYIFIDPPFGENLMYSELNFIPEAWLNIIEENKEEAIINKVQNKDLNDYTILMSDCFREMYRILKPNRWITVEFHNSKASVWNAIQESLNRAGFIVAQVGVLDKERGSFISNVSAGAVKNDLIINAYKPDIKFSERFIKKAGENMEIEFIKQQLEHISITPNLERTEKMLFSKMLAHYVENGFKVKYNSTNFHSLLYENFTELDGYWFLDSQINNYNEWKSGLSLNELSNMLDGQQILLVNDENTALTWLYHFLRESKDFNEIYTAYQQVTTKSNDDIPEIRALLDNNFILENGKYRRPLDQKEQDEVNKNREKELDRAFEKLLNQAKTQKGKIKNIRREAMVHGFTKCYQEGRYQDILTIADKLYASTLESSGEIMDFIDIARIKTSGEE